MEEEIHNTALLFEPTKKVIVLLLRNSLENWYWNRLSYAANELSKAEF